MENLLGWFSLITIFISLYLWKIKYPKIKTIILAAFFLRVICVLIDQYLFIKLPDAYGDADRFEGLAREYSREYGLLIIFDFLKIDSFLISRIISLFYSIFYESKMMAQSISVTLGTISVYLIYYLSNMLWDHTSAKKAAWFTALFPTLILYSSITLREVYVVFFLLIALIGIVKFMQKNSFVSFIQAIISFFVLLLFHGPLAVGGFIFLAYLTLGLIKKQILKIYKLKLNLFSFFIIILFLIPLSLFSNGTINIPYIGGLNNILNLNDIIPRINIVMLGNSSYPTWLTINNQNEIFTKGIIKMFYLLYSPFIWDIKTPFHIIGLFDAILYFILTFYILKNRRNIFSDPILRFIVLLFIAYLIIYGIGTGNFGTGIRHRSKFVVILIVLAAPKIHKYLFSSKNIINQRS